MHKIENIVRNIVSSFSLNKKFLMQPGSNPVRANLRWVVKVSTSKKDEEYVDNLLTKTMMNDLSFLKSELHAKVKVSLDTGYCRDGSLEKRATIEINNPEFSWDSVKQFLIKESFTLDR